MAGYTKLFNSILASTIWRENDKTRIVWITMLAMSDRNGLVEGSLPGLADFARVSIAECKAALKVLSSPDDHSRTQYEQGRRIRCVDGGWEIINHAKYREKMGTEERRESNRKAQAAWRERNQKNKQNKQRKPNVTDVIHAEAEAAPEAAPEAEAVNPSPLVPSEYVLSGKPDQREAERPAKSTKMRNGIEVPNRTGPSAELAELRELANDPQCQPIPKKTLRMAKARPLLFYLNEKAGRSFRETESNLLLIATRLAEVGDDIDGCKRMIDRQCSRWLGTEQAEYLRPETLFRKSKFSGYYDNRDIPLSIGSPTARNATVADTRNQFIAGANDPTYEAARLAAGKAAEAAGLERPVDDEPAKEELPFVPAEGAWDEMRRAIEG